MERYDLEASRYILAPYFQFDGFKGKIEHCYVVQPEDMEMERYGLEPIGARYPISPLSVCTLILLVNKPDQVKDVKNTKNGTTMQ